jgi:hypothetical protein
MIPLQFYGMVSARTMKILPLPLYPLTYHFGIDIIFYIIKKIEEKEFAFGWFSNPSWMKQSRTEGAVNV